MIESCTINGLFALFAFLYLYRFYDSRLLASAGSFFGVGLPGLRCHRHFAAPHESKKKYLFFPPGVGEGKNWFAGNSLCGGKGFACSTCIRVGRCLLPLFFFFFFRTSSFASTDLTGSVRELLNVTPIETISTFDLALLNRRFYPYAFFSVPHDVFAGSYLFGESAHARHVTRGWPRGRR